MSVTLRPSTANIQNFPDMSDPNVRADVREAMSISDLVLWQELGEAADHKAVNDLDAGWATTQIATECAISGRLSVLRPVGPAIKTRISNFLGAGSHSPARDMIEQRWTWTIPTGLPDVWSIDIHYANQAWGTKDVPKKAQRKVEWNNGNAIHKAHALTAHAAGYIVLGGGDWNRVRKDIALFHPSQKWITPGPGGLDHIYVLLPAGVTCSVASTWSRDIHSDHPLKGAALTLTAAAATPAPKPPEVTVPASVATAEARAAKQSSSGPKFGVNECKQRVRELYSVPSDGAATAAIAAGRTKFKHAIPKDLSEIPDGAIIWWTGGSPTKNHPEGAGHVTKKKNGKNVQCWSTDIKRTGFFDAYNIADISKKWPKLKLSHWSEDIDGERVITVKPGTVTAPPPVKARDKMNPANYFLGVVGPHVTWLGQRLVAHGFGAYYKSGPGPTFTGTDQKAVAAFQKRQGWTGADADGLPGKQTLLRLAAAPSPIVKPPASVGGALRIDVTDWSHHQAQKMDYPKAKGAGLRAVIHKATEGETFKDSRYATRRTEIARAGGIAWGAYGFARPDASTGDGADEAKFFLRTAKPKSGDVVPSLDLEDRAGIVKWKLDRNELTDWVGDWVGVILKELGVHPLIYTPFALNDNFGCPLWVARYHPTNAAPVIPAPWKKATLRQFSNGVTGKPNLLAGVGHVDLNTLVDGPAVLNQLLIP